MDMDRLRLPKFQLKPPRSVADTIPQSAQRTLAAMVIAATSLPMPQLREPPRSVAMDLNSRVERLRQTHQVLAEDPAEGGASNPCATRTSAPDETCIAELASVIKAAARAAATAAFMLDDEEIVAAAAMASSAADCIYTLARTAAERVVIPGLGQPPEGTRRSGASVPR